jgi:hypothetical protein
MSTPLEKTLKRELKIKGKTYILAISPEGLKQAAISTSIKSAGKYTLTAVYGVPRASALANHPHYLW